MTTMASYLAELIRAQLAGMIPADIPEELNIESIVRAARDHHMD